MSQCFLPELLEAEAATIRFFRFRMVLGAGVGAEDSEPELSEGLSRAGLPGRPDELLHATGAKEAEEGMSEQDPDCADGEGERDGQELGN